MGIILEWSMFILVSNRLVLDARWSNFDMDTSKGSNPTIISLCMDF